MKPINGAVWTKSLRSTAMEGTGRWLTLAAPFVFSIVAVAVMRTDPAEAACLQSGTTVTCSGTNNAGFGTGAENNLTVTVQPDASINVGAAQVAINLGDGNTAINNGGIVVGNGSVGMQSISNNILTNNGTMTLGAGSIGHVRGRQ